MDVSRGRVGVGRPAWQVLAGTVRVVRSVESAPEPEVLRHCCRLNNNWHLPVVFVIFVGVMCCNARAGLGVHYGALQRYSRLQGQVL